jgi:hypothetical protein
MQVSVRRGASSLMASAITKMQENSILTKAAAELMT